MVNANFGLPWRYHAHMNLLSTHFPSWRHGRHLMVWLCITWMLSPGHAWARSSTESGAQPEIADAAQVLYLGFTPPAGVSTHLIQHIDLAQSEILVQAYGFTHQAIAQALVRAHQRGVKVQVVLDEKSESTNRLVIALLRQAGIALFNDGAHAISHNKVMILDAQVVVTGSFNFTHSAETRNAENLLILRSSQLAQSYRQNWLVHQQHARPL
jgi:phosphatidylserine/phosphatidylglycerophosphate/cardiolipin synthase-like enzyme